MLTVKKIVISLMIFTLLFYMNVNVTKITKSKIIEYYNDIMNERQPNELNGNFIDSRRTWSRNEKLFYGNEEPEDVSVTLPERTKADNLTIAFPTNISDKAVTSRNQVEVVFPSLTNCSIKEYKRQVNEGPRNGARKNLYVCRKWHEPDPNNILWPMMLQPTNGSVLKTLPIHHQDPKVERLLQDQAYVQAERVAHLTATCLRYPELAIRRQFNMVWDTSRTPPLIYCPIYKVASTTWSVYFLRLAHVEVNTKKGSKKRKKAKKIDSHAEMSRRFRPPETDKEKNYLFPKSLRFITVRHPFTRLLSAYRDKIDNLKPKPFQPYFLDLQQAILKKYRALNSNITAPTPTFPEFVDYVIDSTADLTTARDWIEHVVCWAPYWVQCAVCSSDFQVVIKLETMDRDVQFLAEVAQLKEIQNVNEWMNQKGNGPSSAVLPEYFRQLTKNQILLLYQRYKPDFELFGYSVQDYLSYART